MSRLWARFTSLFTSRTFSGIDKSGNRYYARNEEIDGFMKEKRWVEFKGEHDPTSIPVEWICWLNGQRKRAPTPEEMTELEARRERVRLSVAFLKKEEEERKAKEGKATSIGKAVGPDLKSFIRQFPSDSENIKTGDKIEEASDPPDVTRSSEPTGTGESFRPGTWQP
ncbi:uncharacterized protein [Henckelia pumila]|uniref:uncharacterized protein isoform X2 n=1 Tax=Henckelia pumila TaxID=405737 RepID=UPI003C6E1845